MSASLPAPSVTLPETIDVPEHDGFYWENQHPPLDEWLFQYDLAINGEQVFLLGAKPDGLYWRWPTNPPHWNLIPPEEETAFTKNIRGRNKDLLEDALRVLRAQVIDPMRAKAAA